MPTRRAKTMKSYLLALSLIAVPAAIYAQQADPCAGLVDSALGQCRGDQQKLQQQQIEHQQHELQQQQERQNQLAEQQRQMQQQLENMRLQNELLQKRLEHEKSAGQLENMRLQNELLQKQLEHEKSASKPVERPVTGPVTEYSKTAEVKS